MSALVHTMGPCDCIRRFLHNPGAVWQQLSGTLQWSQYIALRCYPNWSPVAPSPAPNLSVGGWKTATSQPVLALPLTHELGECAQCSFLLAKKNSPCVG